MEYLSENVRLGHETGEVHLGSFALHLGFTLQYNLILLFILNQRGLPIV